MQGRRIGGGWGGGGGGWLKLAGWRGLGGWRDEARGAGGGVGLARTRHAP